MLSLENEMHFEVELFIPNPTIIHCYLAFLIFQIQLYNLINIYVFSVVISFNASKPVVESAKWGNQLIAISIATTFGAAVPVGYNIGVINAPAEHIRSWCYESFINRYDSYLTVSELNLLWSAIVSVFLVGAAIGSLGGAWIADHLGSTLPMYMTELSSLHLRGTLGVLCSMGISGGVVIGQIGSLEEVFGSVDLWHVALSFYAVFVIVSMLPFYWFPESPKYLFIVVKDHEAAEKQLMKLRGSDVSLVNEEIQSMKNEAAQLKQRSLWSVLRDKKLMLPIVLVLSLQGGQQLSGLNAVFYYSVSIFESAGLSSANAKWANLGTGFINFFVSSFGPYLMAKVSRRPLLLWSTFASGIMLVILTVILSIIDLATWLPFACIASVFCYIITLQLGLVPIPYFIASELFESITRPAAMAFGSLSAWTCNFIVGMAFPSLQLAWKAFAFLPFAVVCFVLATFLLFCLPETRGRNPSDIAPLIENGFKSRPLKR